MLAMITGASGGIGKDMAIYLSNLGYDLILVARNKKNLENVADNVKTKVQIVSADLSDIKDVERISKLISTKKIDIFYLYGDSRLQAVLNQNRDKSATELLKAVKKDVDSFVGEAVQFDDMTMLGLRIVRENQ